MTKTETSAEAPQAARLPVRRRRWLRWLLIPLALVAGIGWFAPTIVGQTELRQRIPGILFPFFKGEIQLGETSLGWLSPVVVRNAVARDPDGQVLAEIPEIVVDQPLWKLAADSLHLGTIRLTGMTVYDRIRADGSNVEDAGWDFWNSPVTGPLPQFVLELRDTKVHFDNTVTQDKSQVDGLQVSLTFDGKMATQAQVGIRPAGATADQVALAFATQPADSEHLPMAVSIDAMNWSLAPLRPILQRVAPEFVADGIITSQIKVGADLDGKTPTVLVDGRLTFGQIHVAGVPGMAGDAVRLESFELGGSIHWRDQRLAVTQGRLGCDVGEITVSGSFPLHGANSGSLTEFLRTVASEEDYTVGGRLDLARLAALLPQTLQIRDDTQITAGTLLVQLTSREEQSRREWTGRAAIAGLEAQQAGRPLTWDSPVEAKFAAHLAGTEVVFDRLACQSDFFMADGKGSLSDATIDAQCNLDRLAQELARFVDLGERKLTGRAQLNGRIRRMEGDQIAVTGLLTLQQMQVGLNPAQIWSEPELTVDLKADGQTVAGVPLAEITTARVTVKAGDDLAVAELTAPWNRTLTDAEIAGRAGLRGDLTRWQKRVRPWLDLGAWELAGSIQSMCELRVAKDTIHVSQADVLLEQLYAQSPGWLISDPQIRLKTAGDWSHTDQRWQAKSTSLVGTTFRSELLDCDVALSGSESPRMTGKLTYQADLGALSRWQVVAAGEPVYAAQGLLAGTADVKTEAGVITANWQTDVDKLIVMSAASVGTGISRTPQRATWEQLWTEPKLQLSGSAKYLTAEDRLELAQAGGKVDGLALSASGTIEHLQSAAHAKLSGQLDYDWSRLSPRLGPSVTKQFKIDGAGQQAFSFEGTLVSAATPGSGKIPAATVSLSTSPTASLPAIGPDWQGRAAVGWNSAQVYALPVGAGTISVDLVSGICRFGMQDIPVAEGHVRAQPVVRFDRTPSLLTLGEGRVIDQVRASPELCATWMKYVGPMLADAAVVDGRFSLDLTGATVPLDALRAGDVAGALQIHGVDVRPGPLALRYTEVVQQVKGLIQGKPLGAASADKVWIKLAEQTVPFRVIEGRVHHQQLVMRVGEYTIRTQGSVGFDETIDLVAEIPIEDDWIAGKKYLAGLKGQSVRIPVRGYVNRPQLDSQAIVELGRMIASSTAGSLLNDKLGGAEERLQKALEDKLGKGLDRLLPRPR